MQNRRVGQLLRAAAVILGFPTVAHGQTAHVAPANAPSSAVLAAASEAGTRLTVTGRVLGSDDRPIPNVSIYVYQTDAEGEYVKGARGGGSDRPRLFAYLRSNAEGRYQFATIKPGSYPGTRNPGHIHFEVQTPQQQSRVYEIVFASDPFISDNFRAQARLPFGGVVIVETKETSARVLEVTHDIRVDTR